MSLENPRKWPLRPSHSAQITHAICMALADLVVEEGDGEISRRAYLKMCGLVLAAEVFSRELSAFFGGQLGEAETALERLEDEWVSQ